MKMTRSRGFSISKFGSNLSQTGTPEIEFKFSPNFLIEVTLGVIEEFIENLTIYQFVNWAMFKFVQIWHQNS